MVEHILKKISGKPENKIKVTVEVKDDKSECSTINLLLHKLNAEIPPLTALGCVTFPCVRCECEKNSLKYMQYAVCSMPTSSTGVSLAVPVAFEYGYSKVLIRDDKLLAIHQISYIHCKNTWVTLTTF